MDRFPKTIKTASSAKMLYQAIRTFVEGTSINVELVVADMFSIICIFFFPIKAFAASVGRRTVVTNSAGRLAKGVLIG